MALFDKLSKKSLVAIALAGLVAVGAAVNGTPIMDAIAIAFDTDKAVAACEALLNPPSAPVVSTPAI